MNDFLTNLALRAAGLPAVVEPAAPPWWPQAEEASSAAETPEESVGRDEPRERDGTAPVAIELAAPSPTPAPAPTPPSGPQGKANDPVVAEERAIPERVIEVRTEHHDVWSQAPGVSPPVEIH